MPHLYSGLSEPLEPSLEAFAFSLLDSREVCRVLEVSTTSQELCGKPHSQILPALDRIGWESIPPSAGFSCEGGVEEPTSDDFRIAISARPRGVNPQMVGRVPASIEQAYLRQPETIENRGCQEGLCERCKIPIQDSVVRRLAKDPTKTLDLRGGEFLGFLGLPTSSSGNRLFTETLPRLKSCTFGANSSTCRRMSCDALWQRA